MTKVDLVNAIAESTSLAKKDVEKVISALPDVILKGIVEDGKVQLIGFGTFSLEERAERVGRNPKTKEEMIIPAKKTMKFKVGKTIKDALN